MKTGLDHLLDVAQNLESIPEIIRTALPPEKNLGRKVKLERIDLL